MGRHAFPRHWLALVAWFLGSRAVRRLAGLIGGLTTLGRSGAAGIAVAARLISYPAMYLSAPFRPRHGMLEVGTWNLD